MVVSANEHCTAIAPYPEATQSSDSEENSRKAMVIADNLYDNSGRGHGCRRTSQSDQESIMEILQKVIIFAAIVFVIGGVGWFIFLAH